MRGWLENKTPEEVEEAYKQEEREAFALKMQNKMDTSRMVSDCCGAHHPMIEDIQMCPECHEHCVPVPENEEE